MCFINICYSFSLIPEDQLSNNQRRIIESAIMFATKSDNSMAEPDVAPEQGERAHERAEVPELDWDDEHEATALVDPELLASLQSGQRSLDPPPPAPACF